MKKNRWGVMVFAGVLLALILVFFLYRGTFLPGEKAALKKQSRIVSKESESPGESVRKKIEITPPKEETPRLPAAEEADHDIVHERVEQLFAYLDEQEYIQAYNLKEGSYRHFLGIVSKLSARPPVVSGEMNDLSLLRSNIAHFLRVMGRTDVSLTLDILSHEGEKIEGAMEVLYEWSVREAQRKEGAIEADMGGLYEYAAFFLNTVAGKAYLLRRESRVRILLTFYSILILDRANTEKLNRHGVDILPHVNLLIDDLKRYKGLEQKDEYLAQLISIRENTGRRNP
ncbi:MAG: hypothetical protein E4H15_07745 [Syntrophobacterales bacterium]|nr:MAG: hypothetical protein E4H15_07745 [Syntrophobacterales bacterium]